MENSYKFSKQILEDQGFEAKEGNHIKIKLAGEEIEATIKKIEGDQIIAIGNEHENNTDIRE